MILNAFLAAMLVAVLGMSIRGGVLSEPLVWFVSAFIILLTAWINYFASKNPRFLTYGPREYLRESELNHELNLARLQAASKSESSHT